MNAFTPLLAWIPANKQNFRTCFFNQRFALPLHNSLMYIMKGEHILSSWYWEFVFPALDRYSRLQASKQLSYAASL